MIRGHAVFRLDDGPIVCACSVIAEQDDCGNVCMGLVDIENGIMLEPGLDCEVSVKGKAEYEGKVKRIERDGGIVFL